MASTDAKPVPIKNTAYRATFAIYDADGDFVTGAASLDSEVSKDAGTFADCTNEATEIATSSGVYYLDLTATEMNADTVAVMVKTATSGAKSSLLVFYPQESGDIKVDVQTWLGSTPNALSSGKLDTTALQPTVAGRTLDVTATGGAGVDWGNVENQTTAVTLSGTSTKALEPTVAARTLDVSTTGEAGIDWANIGAPTTTVGLTNTTISSSQVVASVTGAVGSVTGAVGSVTGSVGSVTGNVGGNVVGSVASVTGAVGSVTGNVGGNVTGSVGSLGAQAKTDVNTEVVDALAVDTYAEPSGVPAATASLKDKIGWQAALARNKITQTATTQVVRNDADSTAIGTSAVSDDGTTLTRGEFA